MTAPVMDRPTPVQPGAPTPSLGRGFRFELVKLVSLWRVRILLLACLLVPAGFVAAVSRQSALPADTVFGRWMQQSGWAGPLVVLAFCSSWALPLLVSLVAGDVFAAEDRLGTWRHLLVAVRSPRRIFAAKALASLTVILVLVVVLALSSTLGGLASVGGRPLVGLEGQLMTDTGTRMLLAWVLVLAPTLAFAAVGLAGSVAFGRSPIGLVTPALLAVLLDVAQLLPLPVVVRVALPSYGFLAWRGLFTDPVQTAPIVIGLLVSLAWVVAGTASAYLLFVRRDFTDLAHDGSGRRAVVALALPLALVLAGSVGVIAATTPARGSGVTRHGLDTALATAFGHLYRLQSRELHRPDVTEAQLRSTAACDKGGPRVEDAGPGNDWRCVVRWHFPGVKTTGAAVYQLDVNPDGRFVADGDGPTSVNGFFQLHTRTGDVANPLWQFDGLIDLVHHTH